jgi:hypothetical protein
VVEAVRVGLENENITLYQGLIKKVSLYLYIITAIFCLLTIILFPIEAANNFIILMGGIYIISYQTTLIYASAGILLFGLIRDMMVC